MAMLTPEQIDELIALKERAQDLTDGLDRPPFDGAGYYENLQALDAALSALRRPLNELAIETVCTLQAMREALKPFAVMNLPRDGSQDDNSTVYGFEYTMLTRGDFRRARKALKGNDDEN